MQGESVKSRPLQLREIRTPAEVTAFRVIFVRAHLHGLSVLPNFHGRPFLRVGETDRLLDHTLLRLFTRRVRFEVDTANPAGRGCRSMRSCSTSHWRSVEESREAPLRTPAEPPHVRRLGTFIIAVPLEVVTLGLSMIDVVRYRATAIADANGLAQVLAENGAASVAFGQPESANEILASVRGRELVTRACLYLPSGELYAAFVSAGTACPGRPQESAGGWLRVAGESPVTRSGQPYGRVQLQRSGPALVGPPCRLGSRWRAIENQEGTWVRKGVRACPLSRGPFLVSPGCSRA